MQPIPFHPNIHHGYGKRKHMNRYVAPVDACQSRIGIRLLLFLLLFISTFSHNVASAEDFFEDDPAKPWRITADEMIYDENQNQYIARGNVRIAKDGKTLTADFVRFDSEATTAFAEGNVILKVGDDVLTGSSLEMDLEAEIGSVRNGTIFIRENNFLITGDAIQKAGENTYTAEKAALTTCAGDTPAWKITGDKFNVTLEGYGTIKNAKLHARGIPVLYTPYFAFPAKRKRQTGFLAPQIGTSDRKGIEYNQPFFWAISDSTDATIYNYYMADRGNKFGLEYRYVLDNQTQGAFLIDSLNDRKVDDGTGDTSKKYGYDDDKFLRPNSDRYWFRGSHYHPLPSDFFAKLDLDIVSDQDYLQEFKDGYSGFNDTQRYFQKYFDRELDDFDESTRINRLNIQKSWSRFQFQAETRWYDNVIARRQQDDDYTLQKLPFVEFNATRQQLKKTPLYFNLDSEYNYFYSEDNTRGHRIDIHPRVYLPYSYRYYFTIEPSVGYRSTGWLIDQFEDLPEEKDKDKDTIRNLYDLKVDLSTEISRVFDVPGNNGNRLKHTIRPQVIYEYIPHEDKDKYPAFITINESGNRTKLNDSVNQIDAENLVTYSVTHIFNTKSRRSTDNENKAGRETYAYRELGRFKLEQSYDIREQREDDPEDFADGENRRPFSSIEAELEIYPTRFITIEADSEWSPYDTQFETGNIAASLSNRAGEKLFAEYRYTRGSVESFYTNFIKRLPFNFSTFFSYEHNLRDNERLKTSVGLLYESQCWAAEFSFTDEAADRAFAFWVNLYGLGGVGQKSQISPKDRNPYLPDIPAFQVKRDSAVEYISQPDNLRREQVQPISQLQPAPSPAADPPLSPSDTIALSNDRIAPTDELRYQVAITEIVNQTPLGQRDVRDIFFSVAGEHIEKTKHINVLIPGSPGYPVKPPVTPGSHPAIELKSARLSGVHVVVTEILKGIGIDRKATDGKWLAPDSPDAELHLQLAVYDTSTGAKILDETVIEKIHTPAAQGDQPDINATLKTLSTRAAGRIVSALSGLKWTSCITDVTATDIRIPSGSRAGLTPGNLFEVFDTRVMEGALGRQFIVRSQKTGEIKITEVNPSGSAAVQLSGGRLRTGSIVIPKASKTRS